MNKFVRTALLFGQEAMDRLANARVAVFGLGGVGGQAAEALVRGAIGSIDLFDHDTVALSNINRQIFATVKTVGMPKTEAAKIRLSQINPDVKINTFSVFYSAQNSSSIDLTNYDYIIDAIDTVPCKIELIVNAAQRGIPLISCMGVGNKLDPTAFEVCDIYKTSVCPLARIVRRELIKKGIKQLKVVYSKEKPIFNGFLDSEGIKKRVPASNSFVPPVAGLILASECIKDLTKRD